MALHCARRRLGGEARSRCRCRHIHVHYHHLPRRRACTSWVLIPLVLFFAMLAFAVSFLCFTLLYFVASLLSKDSDLEPIKNVGVGPEHRREDGGQEGNSEAKGKAAAEQQLTGDSATAELSAMRLEIKEVRVDGFSQESRMASSSDVACIDCELPLRTNGDELVDDVSIFDRSHANADLEGFSGWHQVPDVPVDWFADEHNVRVASSSTPGDLFPSPYSTDSAEIHDLPDDMDEATGMSPDFLVESKQNMFVAPSNNSSHHNISDENCDDGKELSACTADEIIDFIDKHETRDQAQAPDSSSKENEKIGLFQSSDGSSSAHGIVPDENNKGSTQEKDAKSALKLIVESVATLEDVREKQELQKEPEVLITEANAEQSDGASNEVQDSSSERETSMLSLHSVCEEDTASSDASSSQHYFGYEDDKPEEVTKNTTTGEERDPASAVCNIFENHQTSMEASDGSEKVASEEKLEDEPGKIDDNSASESELNLKGLPVLRRSPSQWWNLCGVVDVFAGSED